jgi:hypothetical protein
VTNSDSAGYTGPRIEDKTLSSWVILQGLDEVAAAGSVLTLDRVSADEFDGIIFAERQSNRWMNGSSFSLRTQDFSPGFQETITGQLAHLAITYELVGGVGDVRVTGYRNGTPIGTYVTANRATWVAGDAEVFFGTRHGTTQSGPGALEGQIEEARLYNRALTSAEVSALFQDGIPGLPLTTTPTVKVRHCVVGLACTFMTAGASGGITPYSYTLTSGSLAAGMTLDAATGMIAGTPAATSASNLAVTVTDARGATSTVAFILLVSTPGAPPPTAQVLDVVSGLSNYSNFESPTVTLAGAQDILQSAGLVLEGPSRSDYVSARLDARYFVTVFVGSYGGPMAYSVRWGLDTFAYFGSNETYFEILIR